MRQALKAHLNESVEIEAATLAPVKRIELLPAVDVSMAHDLVPHLKKVLVENRTPASMGAVLYIPFPDSHAGTTYEIHKVADRPGIVERFHVIVAGSELGNGYSELNDPLEQARRFEEQQRMRERRMQGLPLLDQAAGRRPAIPGDQAADDAEHATGWIPVAVRVIQADLMPVQHIRQTRETRMRNPDTRQRERKRGWYLHRRVLPLSQPHTTRAGRHIGAVEADLDGQPALAHLAKLLHPHGRWLAAAVLNFVQLVAGLPVPGGLARHCTQALAPNSSA